MSSFFVSGKQKSRRRRGEADLMEPVITSDNADRAKRASPIGRLSRQAGSFLWQIVRLPALLLLVILEPLVAFCLGALTLLGVLVSIFLELSGAARHFPLALMIAMALGCGLLLVAYQGLVRLLSR